MATTISSAPAGEQVPEAGAQAASGSVTLDIGAGRGALVIYPGERFRGREIEISPVVGSGRRVHTGVHERATAAGCTLTAIFGSLAAGGYIVWDPDAEAEAEAEAGGGAGAATTISIIEATVTELFLN